MIRPFIVEELKQTLLPGIAVAGASAILTLLGRPMVLRLVGDPLETQSVMNVLVTAMLIVVASAGGSAAFGLSFRQGPLRLLENMPISRLRIWGVRLLVSLLTTVASAGLLIAAHVDVLDQGRETIAAALAVACVVFTAGLCHGMLVQAGTAIVVVLNVILSFPVMAFVFFLAVLASSGASRALFFSVAVMPVCAVNLAFCGFTFLRGEFDVWRQKVRNSIVLCAALVSMAVALTVATDFGALAAADDWAIVARNGTSWSSDGRYLSLILQKGEHHSTTKAVVIDVDAGTIVKTFRQNSIQDCFWASDGTLLVSSNGTVLEKILGTGAGTVRVTRVFPSEERLFSRNRSRWVHMVQSRKTGVILVLTAHFPFKRWEGVTSLVRLDSPGAPEILSSPWIMTSYPPYAGKYRDGIVFSDNTHDANLWLIGEDVRRLSHRWGPFFFQDEASMRTLQTEFRRTMPGQTDKPQSRGVYISSDFEIECDENCWVYFLSVDRSTQRGRLFSRRNDDDSWKLVLGDIPMTTAQVNMATRTPGEYSDASAYSLWTGLRSGVALRIYRSGAKSMISLANPATGERFDFEDTNLYAPDHGQRIDARVGESSIEIIPYRVPQKSGIAQPIRYAYSPGSGVAVPIRAVRQSGRSKTPVNFSSPKGIGVIVNRDKIIARSPDGATRQLWPQ